LPWVIVGSVAPRKVIHAHEFSWDRLRDPVWKRYERIWGLYDARDNLAFTHGFGTIQNTRVPASHCNNIGSVHRKLIHDAFRQWFAIDVQPQDEYSNRRKREELTCLTNEARKEFEPKSLHEILVELADKQLAGVREANAKLRPGELRRRARDGWSRLLGDTAPPAQVKVREGSRQVEKFGPISVTIELVETDPGIAVPVVTLALATSPEGADKLPIVLGIASDGILPALERQRATIATALNTGVTVVLAEVRGTGAGNSETDRGQQSAATSHSATALMLGQPLLGRQLRDLRTVWRHVQPLDGGREAIVIGGSGMTPLSPDAVFAYPRRIDRPAECRPTGALLALLLALYEEDFTSVVCRRGLASFRSVLDTPFVQVPHEAIVPEMLREGDMADLLSALAPRMVEQTELVDGLGRLSLAP
jgi:hypothetical protein